MLRITTHGHHVMTETLPDTPETWVTIQALVREGLRVSVQDIAL